MFPANLQEWAVFAICISAYGAFALYIAENYRIVFDDRIPWDAYFSFDNRSIVMTGGGFERHPLSNYFFDQLRALALWVSGGRKDVVLRIVLALCSALAISLAVVQVFKYLRNIIKLPLWLNALLTAFFSVFSTNILLCFTPETYTYTLLLLCIFNYYSALKLRKGQKIPAAALAVGTVAIGGLTITNAVKVFIPVFFEKDVFKNPKKLLDAAARALAATIFFVLLYLNRLNFDYAKIFSKTGEQYEKFSKPKVTPLWDMVASWFFGGNVLFSSFVTRDYHNKKGFQYKAVFMDVFSSGYQYAFIFSLLLLVLWSLGKNYKNKLVWILFLTFLVDIVIHAVLKFGLHTSYIYGGHFVFVYPLLLGWLLHAYRYHVRKFGAIVAAVSVLLFCLVLNNIYRLSEFIAFLDRFYQ